MKKGCPSLLVLLALSVYTKTWLSVFVPGGP
jgi:hypothetical protein